MTEELIATPGFATVCLGFVQDLKLRYYDLIIALALQEDAYLDACKSWQEVYDTEEIKKDEAKAKEVCSITVFVCVQGKVVFTIILINPGSLIAFCVCRYLPAHLYGVMVVFF